jgi:ABC-type nitrate/sulfonate/bicarbonate transport system ATPase subunit
MVLSVKNVCKTYTDISGQESKAISNVSFSLQKGEFLTIVGRSGSGKSTLLHLIAGIIKQDCGQIEYFPNKSQIRIGLVFQQNAVFPWKTVGGNISFPLELKKKNESSPNSLRNIERKDRVKNICKIVGLDPDTQINKFPKELSGGQLRRLALGMSLAHDADILLLDEPTSQLDFVAKYLLQNTIQEIWAQRKFTAILVTHDLEEAIFLGTKVLILDDGEVIYEREIDLPRPRNDEMRFSIEFATHVKKIRENVK